MFGHDLLILHETHFSIFFMIKSIHLAFRCLNQHFNKMYTQKGQLFISFIMLILTMLEKKYFVEKKIKTKVFESVFAQILYSL